MLSRTILIAIGISHVLFCRIWEPNTPALKKFSNDQVTVTVTSTLQTRGCDGKICKRRHVREPRQNFFVVLTVTIQILKKFAYTLRNFKILFNSLTF